MSPILLKRRKAKLLMRSRCNGTDQKGEFTAIIGTNGSGKSTLARHLNALLIPTEGELIVEGMRTSDAGRVWDIRQKVGMVFQNPDNQLVAAVVEEDVAFGPEIWACLLKK